MKKNGSEDKALDKGSEENINMNIDEQACQQCNTSYKDFQSLVNHTCRPNQCSICPASFDMDYQLFLHQKNCHAIIHGDDNDLETINSKSKFVDSLDENSQLLLNHTQSCDTKRSCEMCKKPLSTRKKNKFCSTCLAIIKKDNREYNLRFKNLSPSNKNVFSNCMSHKNTLNASVANLENTLMLVSGSSDFTVSNKDGDGETSFTHPAVKRKKNGYTDSHDRNIETYKKFAKSGRKIRNIDESQQNIHSLETKIKNSTIKYLEDVEQNSSKNNSSCILKDIPSTSKCTPVYSIDSRKKFVKDGKNEKGRVTKVKQRHRHREHLNRRAETAPESNLNSASQRHQSKVLNLTHEEQSNRSRNYHLKKTTVSNSQSHSKCLSGKVSLSSLIDSLPDNDCGILLQSQSPNESNFKCAKCNKVFRSPKLGSAHFSACKVSRLKKIEVDLADVKFVCIICHFHFNMISDLIKHRRICFDFRLQGGSSKQNLVATVNQSLLNYERACVNWCPKCSYRCVSSFSLQNHSCKKRLKFMRSCFVRSHKLPAIDVESGGYFYECRVCKKVFVDNYIYSRHMANHPNRLQYENVSPLVLNPIFRPEVAKNIKTEIPEPQESELEKTIKIIRNVLKQKKPDDDTDTVSNYILSLLSALPPHPKTPNQASIAHLNQLLLQLHVPDHSCCSSASANHTALEGNEPSSATSSIHDSNFHLYNLLRCQCERRVVISDGVDQKPCTGCLNHPATCGQREAVAAGPDTEEVSESNVCNMTATASEPILNSTGLNPDTSLGYENGSLPLDLMHTLGSALTPPVSHSGLTPPPTPDNSASQYSTHTLVLDRNTDSERNEPVTSHVLPEEGSVSSSTCPDDAFLTDKNMPEAHIDFEHEQESSVQEPIPIKHLWTDEKSINIDAWAILSSKDSNTVEKYVCPQCFCSNDQDSLPKHLRVKHGKHVSEIIALYMVTPTSDVEKKLVIDSGINV